LAARVFKFRLQKVLEMREQREKLLSRQYNELLMQLEHERRLLLELQQLQAERREELAKKQRGAVEVHEVMNYFTYLEALAERIEEQVLRVREAEERAEEARQELLRASQERKAVEKLKEQQYDAWRKEQLRVEGVFLDEMASSRFNRTQAETARKQRPAPGG
jgi:flagellar FliJ protein